jgi:hypothetical protein
MDELPSSKRVASPVCWPPVSHPYLYITTGVADDQESREGARVYPRGRVTGVVSGYTPYGRSVGSVIT